VRFTFNPSNLVALDQLKTIYPTLRVTDAWGILEVKNGALMIRDGSRAAKVHVTMPRDLEARPLKGDGWMVELSVGLESGWRAKWECRFR
jgi:hypothetical protein